MFTWTREAIEKTELDFATMDYKPFEPQTTEELVGYLDRQVADATAALEGVSDETLMQNWKLRNGEEVYFE